MALIAVSFTVEIILLIVALYFGFDSGILRKLTSFGFCMFGLNVALAPQVYISDLTSTPTAVSVKFPGIIQNNMALLFSLVGIVIIAAVFIDIYKLNREADKPKEERDLADYIV